MKRSANSSLEHVIRNRCRPSTHPDVTRMHCELRRGRVTSIERDVIVISGKKEQRSHGYISIRRENQFRVIDVPRADETLCKIDTMLYICRSIRHPNNHHMKQHVWQMRDRCAWAWEKIAKMSSESDKTWSIREHVRAGSFLLSLSALRCILRIFLITLLQSQLRSPEWTPCRQAQACYLKTLLSIETQIRSELIMYRKAVNICYIVFSKEC